MHDTIARATRKYDEPAARLSADETLTSEARAETDGRGAGDATRRAARSRQRSRADR